MTVAACRVRIRFAGDFEEADDRQLRLAVIKKNRIADTHFRKMLARDRTANPAQGENAASDDFTPRGAKRRELDEPMTTVLIHFVGGYFLNP